MPSSHFSSPLVTRISVLTGEASHGTDEFYRIRADYIHIDETHALTPLERWSKDELDLPETYPSAL